MKIITLILLLIGFNAHADFVSWNVGPVSGTLQTLGDLTLEEAQVVQYCQYCNISTCAGGPSKQTNLKTRLAAVTQDQYQLLVSGGRHRSGYPMKKLSSCGYYLNLKGHDRQSGRVVKGQILLAHSRRLDPNPIWKNDQLAEALTVSLTENPLKLEIQKKGFTAPEIYPVESN